MQIILSVDNAASQFTLCGFFCMPKICTQMNTEMHFHKQNRNAASSSISYESAITLNTYCNYPNLIIKTKQKKTTVNCKRNWAKLVVKC